MTFVGLDEVIEPIRCLSEEPRIYVVDGFASSAELHRVLEITGDEATLARHAQRHEVDSAGFIAELRVASDPVLIALNQRVLDLIGCRNARNETLRFRAYVGGESHPPHTDAYDDGPLTLIATALLYHTEVPRGGATSFPAARPEPITIEPRPGRLVVWFTRREDGSEDLASMHEALPVEEGTKTVLTNFIYTPRTFCPRIPHLAICRHR